MKPDDWVELRDGRHGRILRCFGDEFMTVNFCDRDNPPGMYDVLYCDNVPTANVTEHWRKVKGTWQRLTP